eukprot:Seg1981.6 transcript_id=Seg1981.6/GoldUCD/mRNA.D3Y31 product="hypothetical protein" protein_id=Seg1981.6/GoldUCD/D3Y31
MAEYSSSSRNYDSPENDFPLLQNERKKLHLSPRSPVRPRSHHVLVATSPLRSPTKQKARTDKQIKAQVAAWLQFLSRRYFGPLPWSPVPLVENDVREPD